MSRGSVHPVKRAVILIGAVSVIAALVWLVFAVRDAREAARRSSCMGRLSQMSLAIRNYHDKYKCLPPAFVEDAKGRRTHSWRVLLTEFLGDGILPGYDRSKPWDDPANRRASADSVRCAYRCFSRADADDRGLTDFVAVVGHDTLWPSSRGRIVAGGDTEKIAVIELPESDIEWTEPRDISLDEAVRLFRQWRSQPGYAGKKHLVYVTFSGHLGDQASIPDEETFVRMLTVEQPADLR